MKFQPGVRSDGVVPEVWWAMGVADMLHRQRLGTEVEITSLNDHHEDKPNSLHLKGMAFDVRTRHMSAEQRRGFHLMLKTVIDPHGFDTIDEGNHIHCEFDQKPGEVWIGEAPE